MLAEARHDLLVMSDSDTRVGPDLLATLAAEFEDPSAGAGELPLPRRRAAATCGRAWRRSA